MLGGAGILAWWVSGSMAAASVLVSWGGQTIPYVEPGLRCKALAGGNYFSLGLMEDGSVAAWGSTWFNAFAPPSGTLVPPARPSSRRD
jgi:hypothetical protein